MAASRAAKPVGPTQPHQVVAARLLGRETGLELHQITRIILHSAAYYILGSPELSGYPTRDRLYPRPYWGRLYRSRLTEGGMLEPTSIVVDYNRATTQLPVGKDNLLVKIPSVSSIEKREWLLYNIPSNYVMALSRLDIPDGARVGKREDGTIILLDRYSDKTLRVSRNDKGIEVERLTLSYPKALDQDASGRYGKAIGSRTIVISEGARATNYSKLYLFRSDTGALLAESKPRDFVNGRFWVGDDGDKSGSIRIYCLEEQIVNSQRQLTGRLFEFETVRNEIVETDVREFSVGDQRVLVGANRQPVIVGFPPLRYVSVFEASRRAWILGGTSVSGQAGALSRAVEALEQEMETLELRPIVGLRRD